MAIRKSTGGSEGKHRIEMTYDADGLALVAGKAGDVVDIRYALGSMREENDFFQDQQRQYFRGKIDGMDDSGASTEFAGVLKAPIDPFRDAQGGARDKVQAANELIEDAHALVDGGYMVGTVRKQATLGAAYKAVLAQGVDPEALRPKVEGFSAGGMRAAIAKSDAIAQTRAKENDITVERQKGYLRMGFSRHNYAHFIDGIAIEKKPGAGTYTVHLDLFPFDKKDANGERVEFFHGITSLPPDQVFSAMFMCKNTGIPREKLSFGLAKDGRPLDEAAQPKVLRDFDRRSMTVPVQEGQTYAPDARFETFNFDGVAKPFVTEPTEKRQPAVIFSDLTAQELRGLVDKGLFAHVSSKPIAPMGAQGPGVDVLRDFIVEEVGTHAEKAAAAKAARTEPRTEIRQERSGGWVGLRDMLRGRPRADAQGSAEDVRTGRKER